MATSNLAFTGDFGKWFANGDAAGLASWIKYLSESPAELKELRKLSRTYSVFNSSPNVVVPKYMDLFLKHLPKEKTSKVVTVSFDQRKLTDGRSVS